MSEQTCASLQDIMSEALRISWELTYKNRWDDGVYHEPRDGGELTEEEEDMVAGWADGLVHKYYDKMASGRCSLQASIDFDVAEFEARCLRDLARMKEILGRVAPVEIIKRP